ncbi:unnamed protein product [Rangifer tarandus platyrhynchus]|uniref:Uncharacterized protein n=2 Tax=Rangifer tarandus platyrhynchus TaxID=3082113 RepID=A0AC59ZRE4_RANTA|nr:unnamed protein product [Rangifer tarandus platyrhynchus]
MPGDQAGASLHIDGGGNASGQDVGWSPPPPFPAISVPGPPAIDGLGELEAPWQPSPPCSLERAPPPPASSARGGRTDSVSGSSGIQVVIEIIIIIKKSEET